MADDSISADDPQTPVDFANWLKRKRAEFSHRKDEAIGSSGIVTMPLAKFADAPGPPTANVSIHPPTEGWNLKTEFLELREKFVPARQRADWDNENRPRSWQTIRELLQAMELAESFFEGGGELHSSTDQAQPADNANIPKGQRQKDWLAQAMLLVRDNPDWSDAKIAAAVGKHGSTLSRSPEYQAAAALARSDKTARPKGFQTRDAETGLTDVDGVSFDDSPDD